VEAVAAKDPLMHLSQGFQKRTDDRCFRGVALIYLCFVQRTENVQVAELLSLL
jgi:hypothetical protein